MLRVPDLTPAAVVKLAALADLEKGSGHWEDEPRLPAGQAGGGQWTTIGAGAAAAVRTPEPTAPPATYAPPPNYRADPAPTLDDGVYRPGRDDPRFIPIGVPPEEAEEEGGYRSNGPPEEVTALQEMFPGLKEHPYATALLAPLDHFVGFSALADETNLAATELMYRSLVSQIKAINPNFIDYELFPEDGIAAMPWEGRANLISHLLMERASAYYRFRGDAGPLQVETLNFLRKTVDEAYADAIKERRAASLRGQIISNQTLGQNIDRDVRTRLEEYYSSYNINYGKGKYITINNRDYQPSGRYRIPDLRVGNISFDWTIDKKTENTDQIIGFFAANSKPIGVVIIMPSQMRDGETFYIPRPTSTRKSLHAPSI